MYGMYLPDGNTLIPTSAMNVLQAELVAQYCDYRDVSRNLGALGTMLPPYSRETRLAAAKVATVCRRALVALKTYKTQTRIA